MNVDEIQALAEYLRATGIAGCDLQSADFSLHIRLGTSPRKAEHTALAGVMSVREREASVLASRAGVFRIRHPLLKEPVAIAAEGQTIGYLQVERVLSPIVAPCAGHVVALVQEGTLVGYGEPVFEMRS